MSIYRNIEKEKMSIYRNIELEKMSIYRNIEMEMMSIIRNIEMAMMSILRPPLRRGLRVAVAGARCRMRCEASTIVLDNAPENALEADEFGSRRAELSRMIEVLVHMWRCRRGGARRATASEIRHRIFLVPPGL